MMLIIAPFVLLLRLIITVLLTPFIGIGYIILVILLVLPSLIIRRIISFTAQRLDNDLANPVTIGGTIPARDYADWYTAPSQSIIVTLKVKGHVDSIEWLREYILKKSVLRWNPNKDQLEYPELQQYVTKIFGFLFFKWDRNFDIANHVNVFQYPELLPDPFGAVVDEEGLGKICESLVCRPYTKKRSAWEVFLIPNFFPRKNSKTPITLEEFGNLPQDEKRSAVFLRMHHGYSDGVSIHRFLLTLTDLGIEIWEKEGAVNEQSKWKTFSTTLYGLLLGPFALAKQMSLGSDIRNPLHPPWSKKTGKYHIIRSTMPIETIKAAKRANYDVSFHSILAASITGGIRSYFLKNGHGIPILPVKMGLAVAKPGHSWKLRNDYLSTFVVLPIEEKVRRKRVIACEKRSVELKNGALTPFITMAVKMVGSFPVEVARFLTRKADYSMLFSEMKGPSEVLKIENRLEIEDLYFSFGLGTDDTAFAFSSLSYNGNNHLILTIDHCLCKTRQKAIEFMRLVEKELEALQYGDCTNL